MESELTKVGLTVHPSAANFVLVSFKGKTAGTAQRAYEYLLENGVIGRSLGGYGLSEHLRFSVGLEDENRKLVELLGCFERR